jgi:FkbM family methyltransferase
MPSGAIGVVMLDLSLMRFKKLKNKFYEFFGLTKNYQCGAFSIMLPPGHALPDYQLANQKYDKFLPHLVSFLNNSDVVVDVGANVGDTLAGMVSANANLSYVCIEPDPLFFRFLEKNTARIQSAANAVDARLVNAFIGKNISDVHLAGSRGTKHAVMNSEGGIKAVSLGDVVPGNLLERIRLIKSDVDGFDYDVIEASNNVISSLGPLVFFECQFDFAPQKSGYVKAIKWLASDGYCDWILLDNFGEVIIRTSNLSVIEQLMEYIWRQNIGKATRTIYYMDILAARSHDSDLLDAVLSGYA